MNIPDKKYNEKLQSSEKNWNNPIMYKNKW